MELTENEINGLDYVCIDCFTAIEYNHSETVDYFLYHNIDQERTDSVFEKVKKFKCRFYSGSENDLEFSSSPCRCCGSNLAGIRFGYQ